MMYFTSCVAITLICFTKIFSRCSPLTTLRLLWHNTVLPFSPIPPHCPLWPNRTRILCTSPKPPTRSRPSPVARRRPPPRRRKTRSSRSPSPSMCPLAPHRVYIGTSRQCLRSIACPATIEWACRAFADRQIRREELFPSRPVFPRTTISLVRTICCKAWVVTVVNRLPSLPIDTSPKTSDFFVTVIFM